MEKHLISTGFLVFSRKLPYFPWFLPCLCPDSAISAAFFLDGRKELRARNHAIPARTTRFARRSEWRILWGIVDAGRQAPAEEDAASARYCVRRALPIGLETLRWTVRQGSSDSATNGMTIIAIRISSITRSFMNGPQIHAAFCTRRNFWRARHCNIAPQTGKWKSLQGGSGVVPWGQAPAVRQPFGQAMVLGLAVGGERACAFRGSQAFTGAC